ncbi:MAG: thioredoxin domain-containing protein [Verrucomicrobiota bacterium]
MNKSRFPALLLPLILLATSAPAPAAEDDPNAAPPSPSLNRLATEKSPYLLQHADNPVDWYPWGDEAFAKAKAENKPVLLSVGYSTCHWCHVMEHESFEDQETADYLNKHFICVKLDREERPDVDRIYMNFQQSLHGSGGWPLNVFMTPDRTPLFSGTYFPKETSPNHPGPTFRDILERIENLWTERNDEIASNGASILKQMTEFYAATPENIPDAMNPELPDAATQQFASIFDNDYGGFGSRPKFPQPAILAFLLEYQNEIDPEENTQEAPKQQALLYMVEKTLDFMAAGGIYDHLGGGFHRYAVDDYWHIPHFEKMLYDQAQLASVYLDAYHITGNEDYRRVADDIFRYVERDLTHPDGAFYSAENADSRDPEKPDDPHEHEGAFYVWTQAELESLLGLETAEIFNAAYDVKEEGNAPAGSDPFNEFTGKNTLYRKKTDAELSESFDQAESEIAKSLADARQTLLDHRATRPRPSLDDKILTAWNGLMISAYAKAHQITGEEKYLDRATRAATFIRDHLYDKENNRLLRSWRNGPANIPAFTGDYAAYIQALLDLYEASLDYQWLELAVQLQDEHLANYYDKEHGGFFDAPETQTDLILRLKESRDGARPAGNSIAALNLLRLAALLKADRFQQPFEQSLRLFNSEAETSPTSHTGLLTALTRFNQSPTQIVVAGNPDDPATKEIIQLARASYHPNKVLLLLDGGPAQEALAAQNDFLAAFTQKDGKPTLYLCRDFVCEAPANDLKDVASQLKQL